jgi:phosphonate transport system permease protein
VTSAAVSTGPVLTPPVKPLTDRLFDLVVWGGVALALALSFLPAEMFKLPLLFSNSENMQRFLSAFLRPDFSTWPLYLEKMLLTLQIALWGTVLAVVLAIPLGLMCARNVAPGWIVQPTRRLMDVLRSINDVVLGTLFVVAVGLGPFAGVMALALHTAGVLAKLFSEAVESIDPRPVEGVRATGAEPIHEIVWGVLPQVAPLWTSYALYRFESNARSATVLGLIGAGGIGQLLFESINGFDYARTGAIVLVIIVAVSVTDIVSEVIRRRLI